MASDDGSSGAALQVREAGGGVRFEVRVKPRSSRSAVQGVRDGALVVAVTAPPVDGAANEEVKALVADKLDVPRRDVAIVGGITSKTKLLEVRGLSSRLLLGRIAGTAEAS